ncbi:MAG: protoporphyrinogen oxidase [Elusimicrobiota bacterium]
MSRTVVVVGGGITGLSCAYELRKAGARAVLLEASDRLGGKILSDPVCGTVFEGGPDSFVTNKPWAVDLIRELGMEKDLLCTDRLKRSVRVLTRGRLRSYPEGLMLLAPTMMIPFLRSDFMPWKDKLRMAAEPLVPVGDPEADESLAQFCRRRFGEEALETLVGPILAGIHAGDPERLSLQSTFPQLKELEQRRGSITRGMLAMRGRTRVPDGLTLFVTLAGGLSRIVDALRERSRGVETRLKTPAESSERAGPNWRVGGVEADAVVLAAPAREAAKLVPWDGPLAAELSGVEYSSTAVVGLFYSGKVIPPGLDGHGFVLDRRERRRLLAATFSSSKFPGRAPEDKTVIRCFLGGAGREHMVSGPDQGIIASAMHEMRSLLGLSKDPVDARVYRWPEANPQYNVGHEARLRRIAEGLVRHPGLVLAGSSYRGVGLPECIRSGREAAKKALAGESGVC